LTGLLGLELALADSGRVVAAGTVLQVTSADEVVAASLSAASVQSVVG
jgi:hypothetical protein